MGAVEQARFAPERLEEFVRRVVAAAGGGEEAAATVARHLVLANLSGHDSHGVGMLPTYVDAVLVGRLDPRAPPEVVQERGGVAAVEGRRGWGQVAGRVATAHAIVLARSHGVAVVALRDAFHIGRIGDYGEQVAAAGLVSVHFVNVTGIGPLVAPFGGADARFATNPICIALPATGTRPETVLDLATSVVALGKCRVAYNKGVPVPGDALIDARGRPTDDPAVMFTEPRGAIRSFGLHKGYGLALMAELLAGAVGGGGTIAERQEGGLINNMLTLVIDPACLVAAEAMRREIDAMVEYVKASPPAEGGEGVLVAGEPERRTRAERGRDGVPIDARTLEQLQEAARAVGAPGL